MSNVTKKAIGEVEKEKKEKKGESLQRGAMR
jgi:hypothetical protein